MLVGAVGLLYYAVGEKQLGLPVGHSPWSIVVFSFRLNKLTKIPLTTIDTAPQTAIGPVLSVDDEPAALPTKPKVSCVV